MYWNFTDHERLLQAIKLADKPGLLKNFLAEVFTPKELKACTMRLKALCLLNDGLSYSHIQKATGLSSRTIARIVKEYNKNGASQKILRKFKDMGPTYTE